MSEFPILYPGSFEPGTLIPVDLTIDPPSTYFPTGDQVDCSAPDPQPFESYFEPWLEIPAETAIYPPSSGGQDPGLAIFYPSIMDPGPLIAGDNAVEESGFPGYIYNYDLQVDEDLDAVTEFSFEPWTDVTPTVIYDATMDVDAIGPHEDEVPAFDAAVEPGIIDLLGAIDFTDAVFAEEDAQPVTESWFEPWTDIIVLVYDLSLEYDTAQPANEPDPPEFEFSFIVVDVDLFEASTPFPTGDQLNDERDPDTFDYSFEAYSSIPAATETVTAFFIF